MMLKAKKHPQEKLRLKALEDTCLMDTMNEKDFDDIVQITAHFFEVPIVLISLIDESRQWFKGKFGLDKKETDRDVSFCSHAILEEKITIVQNALEDERFKNNPLVVSDPHIRFYAGSPIFEPVSKLPIGTLCLVDIKPRKLSQDQILILKSLTGQIEKLVELRQKVKMVEDNFNQTIFQQMAFNQMSEGVVVQDHTGKIVDINPSAPMVLGLTADQMKGKTSMDKDWNPIHVDGRDYPGETHPSMRCLKTGKPVSDIMGVRYANKETKWISINSQPFFKNSKSVTHVVTTFKDVTQERLNQLRLIQAAKLTSLGEMTSQIAHEINSPLAVINIAAYQAKKALVENKEKDYLQSRLDTIESTVQQISTVVKGLRSFARQSDSDPKQRVSAKKIIDDTLVFCKDKFLRENVRLNVEIKDDLEINCIPALISQVILNLFNNSFDAIKDKSEKWIKIEVSKKYQFLKISVIDSGSGIPKEIQKRLMESYFTTKPSGEGTGLGLSISKEILKSVDGELYYDKENSNTCFSFEIPLARMK